MENQRPAKRVTLRKRLERSETLTTIIGRGVARYLNFATRTTTWDYAGMDDLKTALADGPVLVMTWHSRSVMGSMHWPSDVAPLSALHNNSPIGRVVGAMQHATGLQPMKMAHNMSNIAASRTILKSVKGGASMALTGDGPLGPPRILKDAPLEWARVTGLPIFCYAFATSKGWRAKSWDHMLLPRPYGKGACVFRRVDQALPRKMDDATRDEMRRYLSTQMDVATAQADQMVGLEPGP